MTTQQKFRRTFIAMFWGWLYFILCLPFIALIVGHLEERSTQQIPGVWLVFAVYSVPVVLMAWILILWPIDCIVKESSALRKPVIAAVLGALFGALPFTFLATYSSMTSFSNWWNEALRSLRDTDTWLFLGGAIITGLTAALHVVLKHPRIPSPPTNN